VSDKIKIDQNQEAQMTTRKYIVKHQNLWGDARIVDGIDVSFHEKLRQTGTHTVKGIGTFRTMAATGRYLHNAFHVYVHGLSTFELAATKTAVHSHIRILRQAEADKIDEIERQLADLRSRRRELIKEAWEKGNVVTVKELTEQAEEWHRQHPRPPKKEG
jgi:hypothetical protein